MKTILLILGKETSQFAKGQFNQGLFDAAIHFLQDNYDVITTIIEEGYNPPNEINKFNKADIVIYQYPVYWFMIPAAMKKYMDEVYQYGEFFGYSDGPYGSGGLMTGKQIMFSTTWNAPATVFGDKRGFFEGANVDDLLYPIRKAHTFCGFEELPHFSCHDVISNPQFEQDKARYLTHLRSIFC